MSWATRVSCEVIYTLLHLMGTAPNNGRLCQLELMIYPGHCKFRLAAAISTIHIGRWLFPCLCTSTLQNHTVLAREHLLMEQTQPSAQTWPCGAVLPHKGHQQSACLRDCWHAKCCTSSTTRFEAAQLLSSQFLRPPTPARTTVHLLTPDTIVCPALACHCVSLSSYCSQHQSVKQQEQIACRHDNSASSDQPLLNQHV